MSCQSRSLTKPREQPERDRPLPHRRLTMGLARLTSCVEMAPEGVPQCCSGARARRGRQRHWCVVHAGRPGACHAKAAASPSHGSSRSGTDHCPIAGSPWGSQGSHRAWRWLLKACRSVAQALEREGEGSATGAWYMQDAQERAMPKPQPHQATGAAGATVAPSPAHHGAPHALTRPLECGRLWHDGRRITGPEISL